MSAVHRGRIVAGALVLVALVGLGITLWVLGGIRLDNNVENLARAPVGCDTTLDFDRAGDYLVFVETTGRLGDVNGDCGIEGDFDLGTDTPPSVTLTLRDVEGGSVDLDTASGSDYDTAGYAGSLDRRLTIDRPGDHVLTVESSTDAVFAVAVGRDPNGGVAALRWGGVAAVIAGLLIGGLLLVLASRRGAGEPEPLDPWQPAAPTGPGLPDWPVGPPGFPPPPPTTGAAGPAGAGAGPVWTSPPPLPPSNARPKGPPSPQPPSGERPSAGGDGWGPPSRP